MAQKIVEYKGSKFKLSYELANQEKSETILFLHGWGSNKELMKSAFSKFLGEYRHIYLDMPGFGASSNELVLTTEDYKEIAELFLKQISSTPDVVVGHSFGGKVATLLSPKSLVLLSSAGIVEKKPLSVKLKINLFKFLKIFFGDSLYKLFASSDADGLPKNMYETFKRVVDEDFRKIFEKVESKTTIFWGEKDRATSLESGKKIHEIINDSEFYSYDGDHYFFLKYADEIAKSIRR
jgi:pimeloyl-ACP methyl ester carboxylesterase